MKILKFGGTSVGDAERIARVAELVDRALDGRDLRSVAVVVSAMGGVTDLLLRAATGSVADREAAHDCLREVERRHHKTLDRLAPSERRQELEARIAESLEELRQVVQGVSLIGECTPRTLDLVLAHGERLSAPLLAAALRARGIAAEPCDARGLIVTDRTFGGARVDEVATGEQVREHFARAAELQVVTGFIAASRDGETTTLGRGGSDYTAALLGAALGAAEIVIFTDVDGVMSADPRQVKDAFSQPEMTYEELMELSHFGAKVVYPPTVQPARRAGIPLVIRNTLRPGAQGTRVVEARRRRPADGRRPAPVTGIASMPSIALLRLEGDGMIGVPGIAGRLFAALARRRVNVILITQASSEHSICFAVSPEQAAAARDATEEEFALELEAGLLRPLVVESDLAIVAVVGDGMRERPGLAARLFRVLGRRGINVRAIAQGSSERNISVVLARADESAALRAVHDAFFRAHDGALEVVVAGCGSVGAQVLREICQLSDQPGRPRLVIAGVLDSRHMALDHRGVEPPASGSWREHLEAIGRPADLEAVADWLASSTGLRAFVDCTASMAPAAIMPRLLASGCLVVLANKLPLVAPWPEHARLLGSRRSFRRGLYAEATVGAGLPVVRTLESLLASGDRLISIEGVFSGTLAFLAGQIQAGVPFSQAVRTAYDAGYTEPDPREDLSGLDAARKLLILARLAGRELELDDVEIEPLIDDADLLALPLEDFWAALPALDGPIAERQRDAEAGGGRLVSLARLDEAGARLGLVAVAPDHPCAALTGTNNLFVMTTERYREAALVVAGPGAGVELTAGAVVADLLRGHAEAAPDRLIDLDALVLGLEANGGDG
ncbi:MAG TPA: bifunctional aspartate kinase/homoserine dehydrogenase I [Thermoanaerobaculia bacterium]|nr:bifunctional aspartate kinase/homoserine dehydrogenase I [Thermoanaerobaculia bacterium]